MKNKSRVIALILSVIMLCVSGSFGLSVQAAEDPYSGLKKIETSQFFNQDDDDYYVYYYSISCPYCNMVKEDIIDFATENDNVYIVDYAISSNKTSRYNWAALEEKYNKKIGHKNENNEIVYLEGESAEKYMTQYNKYGKLNKYEFVTVTANNIYKYPEAEIGDVYTSIQTPEIDYFTMTDYEELIIAGIPSLFHVRDGKIVEFYFDSTEIGAFLNQ